jgi:Alpha-L-fucosidase
MKQGESTNVNRPHPLAALWILLALVAVLPQPAAAQHRAQWMREARWGVMNHFLAEWIAPDAHESVARWNALVDGFDVKGLAEQLESVGAHYYLITIGQNSGFYISPNATYDQFVGIQPSHCSRRDLVADLYEELHPRGIRLMVYLPAGAPNGDDVAKQKLQWRNGPYPNREFQQMWEQIIREWAERWGDKVAGWWFDGAYWPNTMYRSGQAPDFASFAAAARAGNPARVLAFNPGVVNRTISITPHEDYIAGEISDPERMDIRRVYDGMVDGTQLHILSYMGTRWGKSPGRFTNEQIIGYTKKVLDEGGVFTWDVPVQPSGLIADEFIAQLKALNAAIGQ